MKRSLGIGAPIHIGQRRVVGRGVFGIVLVTALTCCGGGVALSSLTGGVAGVTSHEKGGTTPAVSGSASAPGAAGGSTANAPAGSTIQGANASSTSSGRVLLRYAPIYEAGNAHFTQAQAVTIAHNFDVIVAHGGTFTPYISAMKAANPGLRIAAYLNGEFDQSASGNKYPSSWYARSAKGNRIQSTMFHNWLMLPTNPAWQSTVAKQCTALIGQSHYDGCMVDTLGTGPLGGGYCTALPIDPATHKVFTTAQWIAGTSAIARAVKNANPKAIIIPNGLQDGSKYFASSGGTEALIAAAGDGMSEIWLRVSRYSPNAFPSVSLWLQDVNEIVNAESHGWGVMTTTKLWTQASAAQVTQWHKYTIATFLMGAGGHSAYCFSTAQTVAAITATTSYDTAAIGTPTGAYHSIGNGGYERSFSNGLVVVNPGNAAVTFKFSGSYTNLGGATVTSETLPPHSGDILVG